jgi:hypothetical protein
MDIPKETTYAQSTSYISEPLIQNHRVLKNLELHLECMDVVSFLPPTIQ